MIALADTGLTGADLFAGLGGMTNGAVKMGVKVKAAANHWAVAVESHSANHPDTEHLCEDISSMTTAQIRRFPDTDFLFASPECFPAGALILTGRGLTPIEDVKVGDMVLTHRGRWRPVTSTMSRVADTIVLRGHGHGALEVTPEHPFYARKRERTWNNKRRDYDRFLGEPEWTPARELEGALWATPVAADSLPVPDVPGRGMDFTPDLWWMIGRWLGDGCLSGGAVFITCGHHEKDELAERLGVFVAPGDRRGAPRTLRFSAQPKRTGVVFEASHADFAGWLREHFGEHAHGKTIPAWALTMDVEWQQALLDGYVSADGSTMQGRRTQTSTVSRKLAVGIRLLAESLGHRVGLNLYPPRGNPIEGRVVNERPFWHVAWTDNPQRAWAYEDGLHAWARVRSVEPGREGVEVFNLSVLEDESYVADGVISHNCTNHSIAKGARRRKPQAASLFDDGPAGDDEQDRSRATMWDVCRFAEQKMLKGRPYKAIFVENVVDAFRWGRGDDGGLFAAWVQAMRAMGYEHEIVWLNSMFCYPVPQSRDRMYVVFWRPEVVRRRPTFDLRPPSWCPRCKGVVAGIQTFKRPDVRWGRYGAQYYYSCPGCAPAGQAVIPGAFPAASIIDWSLPAPAIGERSRPLAKNTRERIRRGLERLASEPFAIRLTHRGSPKPLTLPLSTQTGRHDAAMVLPVSGNTHESTPGNRAKAAERDPLATVHGSLDRAMVFGNTGGSVPRPAGEGPTQTLRSEGGLAMVYANRAHGRPRPVEEAPAQAVCGAGHLGVVVSNYSPGWARRAEEHPVGSLTTQDGHSLVVPYSTKGRTKRAGEEPCDTLTRENKLSLVVPYMRTSRAKPAELEPAATVPGTDRLSLLISAGGSWAERSTMAETEPAPTQTAAESRAVVTVTDDDVDACRFRMFSIPEIARAMSLALHPNGRLYVALGNKREQMAQYGNAVTPPAMEFLLGRVLEEVLA